MNETYMTGIERAVAKAGSQSMLAQLLKSRFPDKQHPSQQAVSNYVRAGCVPLERATEIAELTGVPVLDLVSPTIRRLLIDAAI